MKRVIILGSTGSIGMQAVEVLLKFPNDFKIVGLSAKGSKVDILLDQIHKLKPEAVVVSHKHARDKIQHEFPASRLNCLFGDSAQLDLASGNLVPTDIVLSAISGTSGLQPTIAAVREGFHVALANKETFVTAGELVNQTARKAGATIFPVDSEHAAIHQCLGNISNQEVEKLILTCSGGPFSRNPPQDLSKIKPDQALNHPTWNMGNKITIDSATLMNKGLEVIEARWLFNIPPEKIDILIHPESIIHSMVETRDGSCMAQLSLPDMRLPILYAITGGEHWPLNFPKLDLAKLKTLTFDYPDYYRFRCLRLAYSALKAGGTLPAVLNAANEIAVSAFCKNLITFDKIPVLVEKTMEHHSSQALESMEQVIQIDTWAKQTAEYFINGI